MIAALLIFAAAPILGQTLYVSESPSAGSFHLVSEGQAPAIVVGENEFPGVKKIAGMLADDFGRVTGERSIVLQRFRAESRAVVIVGTLGRKGFIDQLAESGKIDRALLGGKREKFITTVVGDPFPGVKRALVIAGSDKRGTIYGMFSLSAQMGVSPWYWWADVPVVTRSEIYVLPGVHTEGEPKVRYRGIFINDEAPALSGWAFEKFGGFNSRFYEKVFELILRLKGNFLWPAMWGRMFYVDDPANPKLADEMGVVIGTSHHEPMMRAHAEWEKFGKGPWDYTKNAKRLDDFWLGGFERSIGYESLVTIGMRGDGDEPMTEGTAISLLERIVRKQREIISEVSDKPAEETPQVWALYKEVQDYYDKGMRVPDDVTLLFSDDNWGNIRRLPDPKAPTRKGGYGVYYHYDYVGGPRSYKWINTNQIERVWEQMTLAHEYGADRLWIVNVGDIKPMELPISFFLDLAWDPDAISAADLPGYYTKWARWQFGPQKASEIGEILAGYTKYNSRRKPELLDADTYSIDEWHRVIAGWKDLESRSAAVRKDLDDRYRDAYFQLVEFPVLASANLNRMYFAVAMNRSLAGKNDPAADRWADEVEVDFKRDAMLTARYHSLAGGKWNHMMSQTHIGYTNWQQPDVQVIPEVLRVQSSKEGRQEPQPEGSKSKSHFDFGRSDGASVPSGSLISIPAEKYSGAEAGAGRNWIVIPNLGRTGSAVTLRPSTDDLSSGQLPKLEYDVRLERGGDVTVVAYFSPTLDFLNLGGLKYSVAFDEGPAIKGDLHANWTEAKWERAVADNINIVRTVHRNISAGPHKLVFRPMSPGLVLQKIVVTTGTVPLPGVGPRALKGRTCGSFHTSAITGPNCSD